MAAPQKKVTFMNNDSPILMEHEEQEQNHIDDYEEAASPTGCGCGCFRFFSFKGHRNNDNESKYLLQQKGEISRETWWVKKLKKVKEVSEVLAGPKWKTFIRKIGGYCNNKKKQQQFQYDPQSYALNFDSGGVEEEEDVFLVDFSSRFAAPLLNEQRRTGRDCDGL